MLHQAAGESCDLELPFPRYMSGPARHSEDRRTGPLVATRGDHVARTRSGRDNRFAAGARLGTGCPCKQGRHRWPRLMPTLPASFDLGQHQRSFGAHAMFSRTGGGSCHLSVTQVRRGRSAMHPRKRLSIKSATVAGIAASALLGLAGLTLNPAPAKAVVYCQYVSYPAGCVARAGVVLRPRPVARAAVRHNAGGNLNGGVNRVGVRR